MRRRERRIPRWKSAEALHLVDVDERHREHPETFGILPLEQRRGAAVGDAVKLIWEEPLSDRGERLWVQVTGKDGDRLTGYIDNDPVDLAGLLSADQVVEFGPEHIAPIWEG